MLKITIVSDDGNVVRLRCEGEVREVNLQLDVEPIESLLGPDVYARQVLLDLEGVDDLDSTGISWLIFCHKRFRQRGGVLVLHSVPPRVHQLLQFCGLDRVFELAGDEPAALALALRPDRGGGGNRG